MAPDSQSIYRLVLEAFPLGVYLVNREGKITVWSDGAERLTGFLRQDILGHPEESTLLESVENAPPVSALPRLSQDNLELRELPGPHLHPLRGKGGHFLSVNLQSVALRDEAENILGTLRIFDLNASSSFRNRRQDKLGAFGCLDPLTGALNHSMIEARVKESLNLYALYPVPFSILCYGVDDLEKIWSRYGQAAVDATLRIAANVIETGLRPTDFLGRWMKQEFLAILPACGETDVMKVAERLRKMVPQAGVEWWGEKLHATVSIGAAVAHDSDTVRALVGRAEQALHESSSAGGNRVVVIGSSGVRAI
jgi:diguanylate cyclase (GGDEF)-like protein